MYLLSYADSFLSFALCSFGFGLAGVSFSIGIAFTSVWYPKANQGTALGIFGAGNAGAAPTTIVCSNFVERSDRSRRQHRGLADAADPIRGHVGGHGRSLLRFSENKKPATSRRRVAKMLHPLKNVRVWRLGLYYSLAESDRRRSESEAVPSGQAVGVQQKR
jgi:NNP family nitrate/nitrite transporter-like MFS transporter